MLIVFNYFLQNINKFLNKKKENLMTKMKKTTKVNHLFGPPNLIYIFQVPTGRLYKYQDNYLSFGFTYYESKTHPIPNYLWYLVN